MKELKKVPMRLYICGCGYQTEHRWVLKNHLIDSHHLGKREATEIALASEYWANPHYVRADMLESEDEIED